MYHGLHGFETDFADFSEWYEFNIVESRSNITVRKARFKLVQSAFNLVKFDPINIGLSIENRIPLINQGLIFCG